MNIQFSSRGFEDYVYWQDFDKRILKKVNDLLRDISCNPYEGIGKPEPVKYVLSEFWSRRITNEHRLVYRVEGNVIKVAQVRYHYE
jgi:toxin YoeB